MAMYAVAIRIHMARYHKPGVGPLPMMLTFRQILLALAEEEVQAGVPGRLGEYVSWRAMDQANPISKDMLR